MCSITGDGEPNAGWVVAPGRVLMSHDLKSSPRGESLDSSVEIRGILGLLIPPIQRS